MRFSCSFDTLLSNLQMVASVVEDSLSAEDDKNIIFQFHKSELQNEVRFIGISPVITYKKDVEAGYTLTLDDHDVDSAGYMYVQIKSKELLQYLNAYKNLRLTVVDEVIFEKHGGSILCTVLESEKENEGKQHASTYSFNDIPIKTNRVPSINLVAPEGGLVGIEKVGLLFHTTNLLPIMENSPTLLYGSMLFDSRYVVAFNKSYTTVMSNMVSEGGVFTGIRLSYRALQFIDRVISNDDILGVAKTEKHIYIQTGSSEAFIVYDTKAAPYQTQIDMFTKDSYVKVNRIYLKDILKRLSLRNEDIEVTVNPAEGVVKLRNSCFSQEMEVSGQAGMEGRGVFKFKIIPDVLSKAIIGDDVQFTEDAFGEDTYFYYCEKEGKTAIAIADKSSSWFSLVRVRIY